MQKDPTFFWPTLCVFLGCDVLTKPAGTGRLPPRAGVGWVFVCVCCFFSFCLFRSGRFLLDTHLLPLSHWLRGLAAPSHAAGRQLQGRGVPCKPPALTPNPEILEIQAAPAWPWRSPNFPLLFRTLQLAPRALSCAVTAPAKRRASLTQGCSRGSRGQVGTRLLPAVLQVCGASASRAGRSPLLAGALLHVPGVRSGTGCSGRRTQRSCLLPDGFAAHLNP